MTDADPLAAALEKADPEARERGLKRIQEIIDAKDAFMRAVFIALDFNGISGDYAEFGCYGGVTMRLAYAHVSAQHATRRHLWAFDSFQGLPPKAGPRDQHPQWRTGSMAMDVETFRATLDDAGVPQDAYTVVPGYFERSLPPLGADSPPVDIALAYIDCDMYSSTTTALQFLRPRIKHGMVIAFDDWNCWSASGISGERAAFLEFQAAHPEWSFRRFRDIGWEGIGFVVESTSLLP